MEVVPARPEDAGEIARIYVDGWRDTYRGLVPGPYLEQLSIDGLTTDWRNALDSKAEQETVLVAREGSEIVGFVSAIPARAVSRGYDAEIDALYVDSAHRRRGVGRDLFDECFQVVEANGRESLTVWVFEMNPYRRFYESMGGRISRRRSTTIAGQHIPLVSYAWKPLR